MNISTKFSIGDTMYLFDGIMDGKVHMLSYRVAKILVNEKQDIIYVINPYGVPPLDHGRFTNERRVKESELASQCFGATPEEAVALDMACAENLFEMERANLDRALATLNDREKTYRDAVAAWKEKKE